MWIQSVQPGAAEAALPGSRPAGTRPAVRESGTPPADRVVVSDQARELSARFAAQEGPELQLSPERLRELVEQAESPHASSE